MELAASALAQAVSEGGEQGDSENSEDEEEEGVGYASPTHQTETQSRKISVNLQPRKAMELQEKKRHGRERSTDTVTIDALVGVLQDPDRGVPRALETRLKDVKIRRGQFQTHILHRLIVIMIGYC